jgi:hypothetical protein
MPKCDGRHVRNVKQVQHREGERRTICLVGMTLNGQEETMKLRTLTISLGLALAAMAASLVFAATAAALIPVEPGPGSPVTYQHPRKPAAKKTVKRNFGGYPINGHTHVRSLFAPDEP